jgi:tetratricopeptide (TPR) repeat protein
MSCSSRVAVLALVVLATAGTQSARADKAAADAAFQAAKTLMADGKIAEACPKFELSHQQDPQLGSLLNVADCHEQLGKLATAWAEFREAVELARQRNDERESFARSRVAKLAPRIARIELVRRPASNGLKVSLDGRDVTALVGVPTPIDPGEHAVTTQSDEQPEVTTTVRVTQDGQTVRLDVPLESAATAAPDTEDLTQPAPGRARKRIALVTAGVGRRR